MKAKILFIYDDIIKPRDNLKNIVGNLSFSEIVYKRKTFKTYIYDFLDKVNINNSRIHLLNITDIEKLNHNILNYSEYKIVHFFSYSIINNYKTFEILLNKLVYSVSNTLITSKNKVLMTSFNNIEDYKKFINIRQSTSEVDAFSGVDLLHITNECLYDISEYSTFINFISGGFDARFFNKLNGDEYTVTKTSDKKEKIKKEYTFYHLLPEEMQSSFVLPYNYTENDKTASYTMERYNFTDMAIRWIHQAISVEEFDKFMKKAFRFISTRNTTNTSKEEYYNIAEDLYIIKLKNRIEQLKAHKLYGVLANYISTGTEFSSIDEIVNRYEAVYKKITKDTKYKLQYISVIGHGDFCFSNILYDRETSTMKLIDPKGALTEEELWTNPYYDIAKLSHSVCGLYDFFNNGLYDIKLNEDLQLSLSIDTNVDKYTNIFKKYLEKNNFDYTLVRLYEVSLFLSMLPLHMDYPQKVLGFLLNGINIMKEVEKNV